MPSIRRLPRNLPWCHPRSRSRYRTSTTSIGAPRRGEIQPKGNRTIGKPIALRATRASPFGRGWFGVVHLLLVLVIMSVVLSFVTMPALAAPSYLWATHEFDYVGVVDSSFPHMRLFAGYSDLDLHLQGSTKNVTFMWPSSIARQMHPGQ